MNNNSRPFLSLTKATRILSHPAWVTEIENSEDIAFVEAMLAAKMEHLVKVQSAGRWSEWVLLHAENFREAAFLEAWDNLPENEYFATLGAVWNSAYLSSSFLEANLKLCKYKLQSLLMMTPSELTDFHRQPNEVTIYRSHNSFNLNGLSWTLEKQIALAFARKYDYDLITMGVASKDSVVAYFTRRGLEELVIESSDVKQKSTCSIQ